jgi:aflatoxin B1 aldehyde reductase
MEDTDLNAFLPAIRSPRALNDSLEALQTKKVDLYYLHAPDRQVPFAETLEAIDKAYKAGKFTRFGVSNYTAAEVEEIVALCRENGWVQPSVYQVVYNALVRSAEPDLFPVLRKHNIAIYTFNPFVLLSSLYHLKAY